VKRIHAGREACMEGKAKAGGWPLGYPASRFREIHEGYSAFSV
jgi:hypothetical protein